MSTAERRQAAHKPTGVGRDHFVGRARATSFVVVGAVTVVVETGAARTDSSRDAQIGGAGGRQQKQRRRIPDVAQDHVVYEKPKAA